MTPEELKAIQDRIEVTEHTLALRGRRAEFDRIIQEYDIGPDAASKLRKLLFGEEGRCG